MIADATPLIQLDAVRIRHNEHVVLEDVTTVSYTHLTLPTTPYV